MASQWQWAISVFVPKQQASDDIIQFRSTALLNIEVKVFFSILAKRMANFLTTNNYIDTSCQKAGLPGFTGCIEHATIIWEEIQKAKKEKADLHVVWLNLANAYAFRATQAD